MKNVFNVKVYYEDTDAGGVVYYAKYLHFLERGRTDFLEAMGVNVVEYHNKGIFFVVARLELDYRKAALLGDVLNIMTEIQEIRRVSLVLRNRIYRGEELILEGFITLACIDKNHRPMKIPDTLMALKNQQK